MNKYEGKTEEEALKKAGEELGVSDPKTLNYQVISVKKTSSVRLSQSASIPSMT